MLEISGSHIARLSDADLRALVHELCSAELRRCKLPLSALTAGGNQDAPDGGIDVRVDLHTGSTCLDFIPRPKTGFQVKCSDMPPSAIKAEMRPEGRLRAEIEALAKDHGSYVIVSSKGTTADRALKARRTAMEAAIGNLPEGAKLHIDFYDRERLASWVRNYPGVSLWLRQRVGEPLSGWQGYGDWAAGDISNSEYIADGNGRLVCNQLEGVTEPLPIDQGIAHIRRILADPGGIIRLIGLSGLGKTRLVQALFDHRFGIEALDSTEVVYTDEGFGPTPAPRDMISWLGANELRSIIVVDNCNPITHRNLTQIAAKYKNTISLITIEYDVTTDEPEETTVFRLEPASEDIVIAILRRLAAHLSQADQRRIAEFSGGNARVALALAGTVRRHESLGRLTDSTLFERLFHQNRKENPELIRAAEVLSLVYSFNGDDLESGTSELLALATIGDFSPNQLYRHVQELHDRNLIQRRGQWRAVLPHAIANRLAEQALSRIPTKIIIENLTRAGGGRLLKSFSRRLNYLHKSSFAVRIAEMWMSESKWLANPANLDELGSAIFFNISPLAPQLSLNCIEAAVNGEAAAYFLAPENLSRGRWATLLRHLAFDSGMFDRSAIILAQFLAAESQARTHISVRRAFEELFHLYLSGTHASAEQRANFIRTLISSEDAGMRFSALAAIDAMLKADSFTSTHDFSFGSHTRDYGWRPKTQSDVDSWFRSSLLVAREIISTTPLLRLNIEGSIVRHFQGLIRRVGLTKELEDLVLELAGSESPECWIAVRRSIGIDSANMPPELCQRLSHLESTLRPRDLIQKVRAYVLGRSSGYLYLVENGSETERETDLSTRWERMQNLIEELGIEVARETNILEQLLPDLLRPRPGQFWAFGSGLGLGVSDLIEFWQSSRSLLAALPANERNIALLRGFIGSAMKRDSSIANRLLDEAVNDPILGPSFPILQASMPLDAAGAERLISSQAAGLAQAEAYESLTGCFTKAISPETYARILLGIADLPDGLVSAAALLVNHLYSSSNANQEFDAAIIDLGRSILLRIDLEEYHRDLPSHLNTIARACLRGSDAYNTASDLCRKFGKASSSFGVGALNYTELIGTLFSLQPQLALDILLKNDEKTNYPLISPYSESEAGSPIDCASIDSLTTWAAVDRSDRYPKLANEARLLEMCPDKSGLTWTPLARLLLESAPDIPCLLEIFSNRLRQSRSWLSSLAEDKPLYVEALRKLRDDHSLNPLVVAWASGEEYRLTREMEEARQSEMRSYGSFE